MGNLKKEEKKKEEELIKINTNLINLVVSEAVNVIVGE